MAVPPGGESLTSPTSAATAKVSSLP